MEPWFTNASAQLQDLEIAARQYLLSMSPAIEERLAYDIPFYYYHGRIWYLNLQKDHFDLGFCNGHLLSNQHGLLVRAGRKVVRTVALAVLSDLSQPGLHETLLEAMIVNETLKRNG